MFMSASEAPLVIHVGYPKTATTTFQQHVFPHHPEIDYLGKFIPSFRYVEESLYGLIDELLHRSAIGFGGTGELQATVARLRQGTARRCVLLSSESFIHPSVIDVAAVADRLHGAFNPCKILITIREQVSAILSFYWMHGRYGQYLTIGPKTEADRIAYPIPFAAWLRFQKSAIDRNYLGTLHYDAVIGRYVEKFGAGNVCVLLYEAIKEDPDGYARDLGAYLGVDAARLRRLMADKHELKSKERAEPWRNGHGSALEAAAQKPRLFHKLRAAFRPQKVLPPRLSIDEEIAGLREMYRAGNARLARERSLPLERFGYSV
jgi:hypothetical protein